MFLKSDLKNGMVVKMSDGRRRMVWENKLIDEHGYIPMAYINENLCNVDNRFGEYIEKVYLTHDVCYFKDFFRDERLTCIWNRN